MNSVLIVASCVIIHLFIQLGNQIYIKQSDIIQVNSIS